MQRKWHGEQPIKNEDSQDEEQKEGTQEPEEAIPRNQNSS